MICIFSIVIILQYIFNKYSKKKIAQDYYRRTKAFSHYAKSKKLGVKGILDNIFKILVFIRKNKSERFKIAQSHFNNKTKNKVKFSKKNIVFLFLFLIIVSFLNKLLGSLMNYFLGFLLIAFYQYNNYKKSVRKRALSEGFADVMDLIAICIEAGNSIDVSIKKVSEQIAYSNKIISQEFLLTFAEINCLPNRFEAFNNLAERANLDCYRRLTTALTQSEKFGSPIVEIVQQHADEYRQSQLLLIEKKAARIPVLLTIPLVCLILPSLFIIILSPSIIQLTVTLH